MFKSLQHPWKFDLSISGILMKGAGQGNSFFISFYGPNLLRPKTYIYQFGNPALPRLLIVTPALYPDVNYEFGNFSRENSRGPPQFPNQNLRQIGSGIPKLRSNKQTEITTLQMIVISVLFVCIYVRSQPLPILRQSWVPKLAILYFP